jgi:uncharacterized protein (UPF0297 family)
MTHLFQKKKKDWKIFGIGFTFWAVWGTMTPQAAFFHAVRLSRWRSEPMSDLDYTRRFSLSNQDECKTRKILSEVYTSLQEKGYNPINQIAGYILSEDPTYITNFNNARSLIRQLDRDELLQELVRSYLGV